MTRLRLQSYAEGVLKVCEFYLTSPVSCAAGVTGADLKKRIKGIMTDHLTRGLTVGRQLLLTAAASLAIGVPVSIGLMSPQWGPAQSRAERAAAPAAPAFEVASVKRSSPQAVGVRFRHNPAMVDIRNFALIDIIGEAYKIDTRLISGASSPLTARFDILATIPKGVNESEIPAMLQRLLSERLKLKLHREPRMTRVYALEVGKGELKLDRAASAPADVSTSPPEGNFQLLKDLRFPELGFKAAAVTMAKFAGLLQSYVREFPVVDLTGLQGRYNFTFKFSGAPDPPLEGALGADPVPSALLTGISRLGLKLEPRRISLDHLVVDHVDDTPVEN